MEVEKIQVNQINRPKDEKFEQSKKEIVSKIIEERTDKQAQIAEKTNEKAEKDKQMNEKTEKIESNDKTNEKNPLHEKKEELLKNENELKSVSLEKKELNPVEKPKKRLDAKSLKFSTQSVFNPTTMTENPFLKLETKNESDTIANDEKYNTFFPYFFICVSN